jgi:hypothetical protein
MPIGRNASFFGEKIVVKESSRFQQRNNVGLLREEIKKFELMGN